MEHPPTASPDPEPHRDARSGPEYDSADDPVPGPAQGSVAGPSYGPVYGQLEPAPRRFPRLALAGGLMTALALGGAGIAYAASTGGSSGAAPAASGTSSTTSPSSVPAEPGKGHRFGGPGLGLPGMGLPGLGGRILYGQATIQQPDGTLKTVEFQTGTVSAVSGTSITVVSGSSASNASSASYTHTYKVEPSTVVDSQAGGISTVAKGDQVRILATQQNGGDTAVNIVDATKIKSSRNGFGFGSRKDGTGGTGATGGATTNPPAGSTGAVWGYPGGPGGPGPIGPPTEAQ